MEKTGWAVFEQYVEQAMKDDHIVGAAVAVADHRRVLYARGFGAKDVETREPVTPDTIFGCASVSKSFTAVGIARLADEGLLSADDPVIRHIPEFKLVGEQDMSEVRVRHILSHTTGLPPMKRRQEMVDFDQHVAYLGEAGYELLGKPGEYFSYCNDTFLLNGAIIQRKTGQLYRRYMTHHMLDAIGMNRSTYSLEELEKLGNVSTPYVYSKKTGEHEKQQWPVLGTYEVGGGVRSCVLDLVKYGQVYLNGGVAGSGARIASSEGLKRMWNEPMYRTGRKTDYCFALQVTPGYDGRDITLVEHGGGQPGVSSNFGFVPEQGITVAVLTNVTGVPAGAIWLAAVNAALGIPLETKRNEEADCDLSLDKLARFAGDYKCDEGGSVTVTVTEPTGSGAARTAVRVAVEDEEFEARASDDRTLFFEVMGEQHVLRFYFDENRDPARPWAVLAHSRMLRRV